jgi:hypothetical protein
VGEANAYEPALAEIEAAQRRLGREHRLVDAREAILAGNTP